MWLGFERFETPVGIRSTVAQTRSQKKADVITLEADRTVPEGMSQADRSVAPVRRLRMRSLIVPREHGAWGLVLVPLFTGVAASASSAHRRWPLLVFVIAAVSLFWLRTPIESLLGTTPVRVSTKQEWWTALLAAISLAAVSAVCLAPLLGRSQNPGLLAVGAVAALAFLIQAALRKAAPRMRMTAQLAGAIGLTSTAPAAYLIGTGRLDRHALMLWAANWIFAGNQIHFVQLRIHTARASGFSEKFGQGWMFFLAQFVLLAALIYATLGRWAPPLIILAFLPVLVRGTFWFFREAEPLAIRSLGWSEMRQGILFGVLLALAFVYP